MVDTSRHGHNPKTGCWQEVDFLAPPATLERKIGKAPQEGAVDDPDSQCYSP